MFPSVFASVTAPKAIPDNDPFGVIDDIVVPDKGVVTALTVQVDITNSDITGLKVTLLDPTSAAYVLFKERLGRMQLAGVIVIVAGVVALAVARA